MASGPVNQTKWPLSGGKAGSSAAGDSGGGGGCGTGSGGEACVSHCAWLYWWVYDLVDWLLGLLQ